LKTNLVFDKINIMKDRKINLTGISVISVVLLLIYISVMIAF